MSEFKRWEEEEEQLEQLEQLEARWSARMERFTAPVPSTESILRLLERVKAEQVPVQKPADLRAELEAVQMRQSPLQTLFQLVSAQWNFYGSRSWLMTALLMVAASFGGTAYVPTGEPLLALMEWVKWMTLLIIVFVGWAFRSKNEGMRLLERLGAYSLVQQLSARFVLVIGFQMILAGVLSLFVRGASLGGFWLSWSIPMLFFGVALLALSTWANAKVAVGVSLGLWSLQFFAHQQLGAFDLFALPGMEHFAMSRWVTAGLTVALWLVWRRRIGRVA
jgi:hypothetical protein